MSATNEYLMLLRETDWDTGLDTGEIEKITGQYTEWFDRMLAEGKITGGRPLLSGGRVVSLQSQRVSDGPFIESKEAIGGYIVLRARDFNEACEIAKSFPPIRHGVRAEIRELTEICPISQRLAAKLAAATT